MKLLRFEISNPSSSILHRMFLCHLNCQLCRLISILWGHAYMFVREHITLISVSVLANEAPHMYNCESKRKWNSIRVTSVHSSNVRGSISLVLFVTAGMSLLELVWVTLSGIMIEKDTEISKAKFGPSKTSFDYPVVLANFVWSIVRLVFLSIHNDVVCFWSQRMVLVFFPVRV